MKVTFIDVDACIRAFIVETCKAVFAGHMETFVNVEALVTPVGIRTFVTDIADFGNLAFIDVDAVVASYCVNTFKTKFAFDVVAFIFVETGETAFSVGAFVSVVTERIDFVFAFVSINAGKGAECVDAVIAFIASTCLTFINIMAVEKNGEVDAFETTFANAGDVTFVDVAAFVRTICIDAFTADFAGNFVVIEALVNVGALESGSRGFAYITNAAGIVGAGIFANAFKAADSVDALVTFGTSG